MAEHAQGKMFRYQQYRLFRNDTLAMGAYGQVCRAKLDELPCAAKLLHPILVDRSDPKNQTNLCKFEQECRFLSEIRHPNIVQYLGMVYDKETSLPDALLGVLRHSSSLPRAGRHQRRHRTRIGLPSLQRHHPPRPLQQQRVADRSRLPSQGDRLWHEQVHGDAPPHDSADEVPRDSGLHGSRSPAGGATLHCQTGCLSGRSADGADHHPQVPRSNSSQPQNH